MQHTKDLTVDRLSDASKRLRNISRRLNRPYKLITYNTFIKVQSEIDSMNLRINRIMAMLEE